MIGLLDLLFPPRLEQIYADSERDYYWSDDWTPEFFVAQAKAGFISISFDAGEPVGQVLLPQIHVANAVLEWGGLRVSRSMRRWLRSSVCQEAGYELRVDHALDEIISGIERCHGNDNWLSGRYPDLLREVDAREWRGFELMSVGLVDKDGVLVGGELGCVTGKVYTSMTGFLDRGRKDFNNVGKLQLLRLAEHLRDEEFAFWNLGQPWMRYKFDLGAKVIQRAEFLERWAAASI